MNKDKQIEEMASDLCDCMPDLECNDCTTCPNKGMAEYLYNAGYRKASEVAREIFEEIERAIDSLTQDAHQCVEKYKSPAATPFVVLCEGKLTGFDEMRHILAELKKKYTKGRDG